MDIGSHRFRVHLSAGRSRTCSGLRGALALIAVGAAMLPCAAVHAQADFEGIWVFNLRPGVRAAPSEDEIRYTPAGRAEWERFGAEIDPSFRCIMPGIPRGFTDPYPIEIIQQEHQIVILHEYYHQVRRIFMDGRQAPDYWPKTLGGYSTGHWEGETLVVQTTLMSPDNLMDIHGRPFSAPTTPMRSSVSRVKGTSFHEFPKYTIRCITRHRS